jgi:hypothetical protein
LLRFLLNQASPSFFINCICIIINVVSSHSITSRDI